MSHLLHIKALLFITFLLASCASLREVGAVNSHPLETARVMDDRPSQIIVHKGHTVSYNEETRLPNWVAYELTCTEADGTYKRNGRFFQDPDADGPQADNEDYRNTGWDKGHIAPAGDMKWDEQAMLECCYFTNICPQNHNLNGGDWRSLEEKCRDYARHYGSVYIAAGPIVGDNKNGTIGYNQVVVPDAFYKVLLVCIDGQYEGIGFYFKNVAGHQPLPTYAKTIDEIEALTGIDFFFMLPDDVEDALECTFDEAFWF